MKDIENKYIFLKAVLCFFLAFVVVKKGNALQLNTINWNVQKNKIEPQKEQTESLPNVAFLNNITTTQSKKYGPFLADSTIIPKKYRIIVIVEEFNYSSLLSKNNNTFFKSWLFYMYCLSVGIITLIRLVYSEYFRTIYRSFTNYRVAKNLFNSQSYYLSVPSLLMHSNTVFLFSMVVYLIFQDFVNQLVPNPVFGVMYIMLVVGGLWVGRFSLIQIISFIVPFGNQLRFYFYNISLINILLSIILLPLLILYSIATFLPIYFKYIFLVTVIIFVLFRLYRGFSIAREYQFFHKFYFFLYLCTLEIAPFLIIVKILQTKLILF